MFVKLLRRMIKPQLMVTSLEAGGSASNQGDVDDIDYRALFENAAAGIGRTSVATGRVIHANRRLAEIFGYDDVDQFIREYNFSEHYPSPDGRQLQLDHYRNHPGELVQASFTNRTGELIYVDSEVRLGSDEQYVDFVLIDVTERVKATLDKRQFKNILDAVIHHSHIPISVKNLQDRYIFVSPAFTRFFGKTIGEVEDETAASLLDAEAAELIYKADQKIINSGKAFNMDECISIRIGDSSLQVYKFPIFDEDGTVSGVGSIALDITESEQDKHNLTSAKEETEWHHQQLSQLVEQRTQEVRERDEMFRRFYEVIPDVFMITEIESGLCVSVNDGFCEATGYNRDEVINRSTLELNLWKNKRDRGKLISGLKNAGFVSNLNAEFRKKDGSFWPGIMSACIAELGGQRVVLSATKDISDIRQAQDQAIRANQAKSQFLSSMSHELRTPLNAILGFAQILQFDLNDVMTEKQKNAIDLIATSGQHLLELINQVLDLSGIETGMLPVKIEPVQVQDVIADCISLSRSMGEPLGIRIDEPGIDQTLPVILADPLRFRQVLLNLLSNAIKYSNKGDQITVRTFSMGNEFLRVSIADTGNGIAEDDQGGIFEPFKRYGEKIDQIQGAGIGLSISKQLVEAMDGKIGFESRIGKGSTFWFDVLTADSGFRAQSVEVPVRESVRALSLGQAETPSTILYIEDNLINVEFMEMFFEDIENSDLVVATTAGQGIEIAQSEKPNLIIMDIGLPDMSGIEATRQLKNLPATRDIPIIALSAAAMQDDLDRAKEVGFDTYVTKPIQVDAFLDLLQSILGDR